MGSLQSETFANDAARLSAVRNATAPASGGTTTSLQVIYFANSDSYVFSAGGRRIEFGPDDIDAGQSNAQQTTYVVQNGSRTDQLTVTNAGLSGPLTYRYVAGALWRSTAPRSAGGLQDTVYATALGAQTAAGNVPATGAASFDVDVLGYFAYDSGSAMQIAGTGEIQVNFATGTVVTSGAFGDENGDPVHFDGAAQIVSGQNQFIGNIHFLADAGPFLGDLTGSFYGPGAQEVGAAFYAENPNGTAAATATLIGRRGEAQQPNTSFVGATDREFFTVQGNTLAATHDTGDQLYSGIAAGTEQVVIRFEPENGHYVIVTPTDTFLQWTQPDPFGENWQQLDYEPGREPALLDFANGDYVRAAMYGMTTTVGDRQTYLFRSFIYGYPTLGSAVPVTGQAGYELSIGAILVDKDYEEFDWPNSFHAIRLVGDGALQVDFATGEIDLRGALEATNGAGKANVEGAGTLAASSSNLDGSMTITGPNGTEYIGAFDGAFYGPALQEVAATFNATANSQAFVQGFFLGAHDEALSEAAIPLGEESETRTYAARTADDSNRLSGTEITYDPAADSYTLLGGATIDYTEFTLGPGEYDAARSDATRRWYEGEADDIAITGWFSKPGAGNTQIALTYTGFGHFDTSREVTTTSGTITVEEGTWYLFGRQTPPALVPRFGQATYSGIALGDGELESHAYEGAISGTSALALDFGAGTATATLNLSTEGTTPISLGTYTFSGEVGSYGFAASLPYPAQNGRVEGSLFGQNAEEFGFVWQINEDGGPGPTLEYNRMRGIAVGTKDTPP